MVPDTATGAKQKVTEGQAASYSFDAQYSIVSISRNRFRIRFSSPVESFESGGKGDKSTRRPTSTHVEFVTTDSGHVASLWAPTETSDTQLYPYRYLASFWTSKKPALKDAVEDEIGGQYAVTYQNSDDGGVRKIWNKLLKEQRNIVAMPGRSSVTPTAQTTGVAKMKFDRNGLLSAVASDRSQISFFGDQKVSSFKDVVKISQQSAKHEPVQPFDAPLVQFPITPVNDEQVAERELQTKALKNATFDQLVNRTRKPFKNNQERVNVFVQLRALFYLDASACKRAADVLLDSGPTTSTFGLVLEGVAGSGTESAQQVLASLLADPRLGAEKQLLVLRQVSSLPSLTETLYDKLSTLASSANPSDTIRFTAQLVLGSICRHIAENSPTDKSSARISSLLVASLDQAKSSREMINLLYALGNAKTEQGLNRSIKFLGHQETDVRMAAIHSLRLWDKSIRQRWLTPLLVEEADAAVIAKIKQVVEL